MQKHSAYNLVLRMSVGMSADNTDAFFTNYIDISRLYETFGRVLQYQELTMHLGDPRWLPLGGRQRTHHVVAPLITSLCVC